MGWNNKPWKRKLLNRIQRIIKYQEFYNPVQETTVDIEQIVCIEPLKEVFSKDITKKIIVSKIADKLKQMDAIKFVEQQYYRDGEDFLIGKLYFIRHDREES